MLNDAKVMAMVPVRDLATAKKFYEETLELKPFDENPGGVAYRCGGTQIFVYPTPEAGTARSTVATWEVSDIAKVVGWLKEKGVQFEHYDYPGATHEGDVHVWENMRAAWFRDSDGNVLGLSAI